MTTRNSHVITKLDIGMLIALHGILTERSVTKAAERYGISQPAMSNALARMRSALGDPLLVREQNVMTLTARGHEILGKLQSLVPEIERLTQPSEFDPASDRTEFNVAATDHAAMLLGPSIVSAVRAEAPLTRLVLTTLQNREIAQEHPGDHFDVRIGFLRTTPSTWIVRKLIDDEIVLIASSTNTAVGPRLSMEEFVSSRQLGTRSREPQDRAYLDQVLATHGVKRNVVGWVTSFSMLPHLISGTDLLAAFPRSLAERFSNMGIRVVEPPFPLGKDFNVSMAWPARAHHDPSQRWLRRRIIEIAGGHSL